MFILKCELSCGITILLKKEDIKKRLSAIK